VSRVRENRTHGSTGRGWKRSRSYRASPSPNQPRVRLLLHWASIPVELPSHFGALAARRGRLHPPDAGGPELIFEVRNSLLHPPKRIEEPEWPNRDELLEAWQLAT
jgi:hypothetical protein